MDLHELTAAPLRSDDDLRTLLNAFEANSLPRDAWNHRAHLSVALHFGRQLIAEQALERMRSEILRFNAAVGIESTPDSGYHETLTVFYMHFVSVHVARYPAPSSVATDANAFVAEWGRRDLPLEYYSRSVLFSPMARAMWVAPDIAPLPIP